MSVSGTIFEPNGTAAGATQPFNLVGSIIANPYAGTYIGAADISNGTFPGQVDSLKLGVSVTGGITATYTADDGTVTTGNSAISASGSFNLTLLDGSNFTGQFVLSAQAGAATGTFNHPNGTIGTFDVTKSGYSLVYDSVNGIAQFTKGPLSGQSFAFTFTQKGDGSCFINNGTTVFNGSIIFNGFQDLQDRYSCTDDTTFFSGQVVNGFNGSLSGTGTVQDKFGDYGVYNFHS